MGVGSEPPIESPQLLGFGVAALCVLHPLQAETVISSAQRGEDLCSLLYLITLYRFIRGLPPFPTVVVAIETQDWQQEQNGLFPTMSVFGCLTGIACKGIMVTAPVVILLYDRTFGACS